MACIDVVRRARKLRSCAERRYDARMRTVEFSRLLDEQNALRVSFDLERGRVLRFTVQLECRFGEAEALRPVIRYDTAHGFAHMDRLHPCEATVKTPMATRNYNEALNIAMDDLLANWTRYRWRYERWLKED